MAITENNSGSQLAVITTPYSVPAAITSDGAFSFSIDVSVMADGDVLKIEELKQVNASSTIRATVLAVLSDAQADLVFETDPEVSFHSLQYRFTQTASTGRTFEWSVGQAS